MTGLAPVLRGTTWRNISLSMSMAADSAEMRIIMKHCRVLRRNIARCAVSSKDCRTSIQVQDAWTLFNGQDKMYRKRTTNSKNDLDKY